MTDVVAVTLRALSFIAVAQAAGIPLFLWLFGDGLHRAGRAGVVLGRRSAAAGLLLTAAHQIVVPAQLLGSLRGIFDAPLQAALLASDAGTANAMRTLGLAMAAAAGYRPGRAGAAAALVGGTLIVVSFAFMGHTVGDDLRWLLAALLILHLLIVAFWFGSLWPLYLVSRLEDLRMNGSIVERFSALAFWLVPIIFVAGLGMALVLLPSLAGLGTPYGMLLIAKIAGFALLMGLAALNKWRLGPSIKTGNARALHALRRSVQAEWALVAAILGITATMTALFSPTHG